MMREAPLVIVADGTRQPGCGLGLAAVLAAESEPDVVLITSVAGDSHSDDFRELLENSGVRLIVVAAAGILLCENMIRTSGHSISRPLPADLMPTLTDARAICVVDGGNGITSHPQIRQVLAEASGRVPIVWVPHLRGADPIPDAALVAVDEVRADGCSAEALRERWEARAACVTLGVRGTVLATRWNGSRRVPGAGTCGGGNRFAVAAAAEFGRGADALIATIRAARSTNAVGVRTGLAAAAWCAG